MEESLTICNNVSILMKWLTNFKYLFWALYLKKYGLFSEIWQVSRMQCSIGQILYCYCMPRMQCSIGQSLYCYCMQISGVETYSIDARLEWHFWLLNSIKTGKRMNRLVGSAYKGSPLELIHAWQCYSNTPSINMFCLVVNGACDYSAIQISISMLISLLNWFLKSKRLWIGSHENVIYTVLSNEQGVNV